MEVLHLSSSDVAGGAARATYRLHRGLRQAGYRSQMLVQAKSSRDSSVLVERKLLGRFNEKLLISERLDDLPVRSRSHSRFSTQWVPNRIVSQVAQLEPSVIHLHWIFKGFLNIENLAQFKQPLVWTLHDMAGFTGGCHYAEQCDRYTKACGACPQLQSSQEQDLSRWIWNRKAKAWRDLNLVVVTPSQWLADCASQSSVFRHTPVRVIPNGLDLQIYKPFDRQAARDRLNLPQDKLLVLFGALDPTSDTRKGWHLLQSALQKLRTTEWKDKIELVIFGVSQPEELVDVGFKVHYLGHFNDDVSLAIAYAAAGVMVVPSVQEAFGQTASESLACGTPVVAFDATGLKDIVDHQVNGFLATAYQPESLVQGIIWVLEDLERHQFLSQNARKKAETSFCLSLQAQQHVELYSELVEKTVI
ncbi:glycosyltransferase family 4 protein [Cyanobacteria bacterium FACHB-63]|nr:glycosyltransferase family 4 protein [Cyanobacteria bacterium FACHB-63]